MVDCNDGAWSYSAYDDNNKWKNKHGAHWYQHCSYCAKGKKYSSPIQIPAAPYGEKKFETDMGYKLEPIVFSFPYKYGYGSKYSYKLRSAKTLEIYPADGKFNAEYKDGFTYKDWTVLGGALHHKAFCLHKVVIHWGIKSTDYAGRRRLAGATNTGPADYYYKGAEHTFEGQDERDAAEVQFWTWDCKSGKNFQETLTSDEDADQYKVAVFSVIYTVDYNKDVYDPNARRRLAGGPRFEPDDENMYKKSWYKIASYYVGNGAHETTGVPEKMLQCYGACKTMSYSDHNKYMYIDLHEMLPRKQHWNKYYFYKGGLTQPPCTPKKVKWHIMKEKMPINRYLLYKFGKYVKDQTKDYPVYENYREIQTDADGFYEDGATKPKVYDYNSVAGKSAVVAICAAVFAWLL